MTVTMIAEAGYTVEDLDWLRSELGIAHIELDPWGGLVVSPNSDEHEIAIARMIAQAIHQLRLPEGCVHPAGLGWVIPGGSGYANVPDFVILAPGWRRADELHFDPPPLLVAEVASRSTRRADRTRKLDDYRLGGAGVYLLVEPASPATFVAHDFAAGTTTKATGQITVAVGDEAVTFTLK